MAQISAYTATSSVANDDYLLINGTTNGTRRISASDLSAEMDRLCPPIPTMSESETISGDEKIVFMTSVGTLKTITFSNLVEAVLANIPEDEESEEEQISG